MIRRNHLMNALLSAAALFALQAPAVELKKPGILTEKREARFQKPRDAKDHIIHIDQTIQCELITDELLKKFNYKDGPQMDVGFEKWLLTFNEIPGKPPYFLEQKRIAQANPDAFVRIKTLVEAELARAKTEKIPFRFLVSARGYLPGEEITIRLVGKDRDVFREVTFCPRPLILRKKTGEILLKAVLKKYPYQLTSYDLNFCGIGKGEKFQFISASGPEKIANSIEGPVVMNYIPGILGERGGVGRIELKLADGSFYRLELPWGQELAKYNSGNK